MGTISRPLKIYCENSAALAFSNNKSSSRLLAINHDVKYYVLKDILEDPLVSIDHISTSMMIADPGRAPGPLPGDISTAILWSFLSKFFKNWRKTLNPFVHKLVKYTCNRSICTTALIYRCQSLPIGMRVKLPSKKLSNAINKMENSPTLTFNGK